MTLRKGIVGKQKKEPMECKNYERENSSNIIRRMSSDNDILMSNNCNWNVGIVEDIWVEHKGIWNCQIKCTMLLKLS